MSNSDLSQLFLNMAAESLTQERENLSDRVIVGLIGFFMVQAEPSDGARATMAEIERSVPQTVAALKEWVKV